MKKQIIVLCGTVLGTAAFAEAQQFGTLNDNFGNNALNVFGGVGPAQASRGPYDPYEFNGVSTSELDPSANQGVSRNWIGINNSSGQTNSVNLPGSSSTYWANPWTGYSWNKNDGNYGSNDVPQNGNFVSTGDRSTGGGYPPGIGSNWLVSAPVKFVTGETISFMFNSKLSNQDYLEARISTFSTAAAALAAPNTGTVLTGTEPYQITPGNPGTPNDGSSYQNVGDFKTVIGSIGVLDATGQPDTSQHIVPTTWTLETFTIPASANGLFGRIGFYYFDQSAGQSAATSFVVAIDSLQSNINQLTPNPVQWGLGVAASQSWNSAGNWAGANPGLNAGIPSGQAANVLLGNLPDMTYSSYTPIADPGAQTITLDAAQTVGKLTFDNATDSYTIAAGTGGSLKIDDTGDPIAVAPQINVNSGSHAISAPITLANGVSVNFSNGTTLTISNTITGSGAMSVNGAGTLTIASTGLLNPTSALSLTTGAHVALAPVAAPSTPAAQTIASLAIDGTSRLDIGNNKVTITTASVGAIKTLITSGYSAGTWTGATGIISSSAQADSHHGVGYQDNGAGGVVMRYALYGDTDLDGTVNFVDLLKLAQNYNTTGTVWATGDSSYDGTTNFVDLLALAQNYNTSLTPGEAGLSPSFVADWNLAQSEVSAVPEPTSLSIMALGALALSRRRRK